MAVYCFTILLGIVPGGMFVRQLHQWSAVILVVGMVVRVVVSRALPWVVLLGTGAVNVSVGYTLTDGQRTWWYAGHLVLAVAVAVVLVRYRRFSVRHLVPLCAGLLVLALLFPLNQIWLYGPTD